MKEEIKFNIPKDKEDKRKLLIDLENNVGVILREENGFFIVTSYKVIQPKAETGWKERFDKKFLNREGIMFYRMTGQQVKAFIAKELERQRRELIERIDPFDLVEPCQPDCTKEQHTYHQGTWDSYIKLEKKLQAIKEEKE